MLNFVRVALTLHEKQHILYILTSVWVLLKICFFHAFQMKNVKKNKKKKKIAKMKQKIVFGPTPKRWLSV